MVGFVYAEELQDYVEAERAFARVVNLYPDSDVAESAQYMLDTMDEPVPKFEGVEGNKR
jgi:outer membrane protein assembly factor BamD (BamD/ComL family)